MVQTPRIDQEFKALIPPLSDEEYAQLTQNIVQGRKCHDAILLWNGLIVDGFNRFCICMAHGIEFKVEEMQFASRADAKIWIIENQLGRRNLCDAARIELALCRMELLREQARERQSQAGGDRKSEKSLYSKRTKLDPKKTMHVWQTTANDAGVGLATLSRYSQIKKSASPKLLEKVKSGELKIGTAFKMLPKVSMHKEPMSKAFMPNAPMPEGSKEKRRPKEKCSEKVEKEIEKQLKKIDKSYAYIKIRLPFDDSETNAKVHEKLEVLAAKLHDLIKKVEQLGGERNA